MPLAGRIRLRTFLFGVSAVALGLWGVAAAGALMWMRAPDPSSPAAAGPARGALQVQPAVRSQIDHYLLPMLGRDLHTDKLKDALPGGPKINVYQDIGQTSVNRAKVDFDRDEQDDEVWSFADGTITRKVSPEDDGAYPETWTWTGSAWTRTDAGAAATAPAQSASTPPSSAAPAGRPVDVDLMQWNGRDLGSDKKKDVTSGKPYKINVYQDAGQSTANRAKIDLDRDDKWDEKITFEPTRITREVAPADDEQYTETWHWSGSGWVRP